DFSLEGFKVTYRIEFVTDDMTVPNVKRVRFGSRLSADQDDRLAICQSVSHLIPNVRIITGDISKACVSFSDSFFDVIDGDCGVGIFIDSVRLKTSTPDCGNEHVSISLVIRSLIERLNHEASRHGQLSLKGRVYLKLRVFRISQFAQRPQHRVG